MRSILGASFRAAPWPWHFPQNSRVSGLDGRTLRGALLCWAGTVWHVVHWRRAWLDTAVVRWIWAWQAEQDAGSLCGTGSWGLWHVKQGFTGLWAVGLIWGKPVGLDGSYPWQSGQNFRSRGAKGFTSPGFSACFTAGP